MWMNGIFFIETVTDISLGDDEMFTSPIAFALAVIGGFFAALIVAGSRLFCGPARLRLHITTAVGGVSAGMISFAAAWSASADLDTSGLSATAGWVLSNFVVVGTPIVGAIAIAGLRWLMREATNA